MGVKKETDWRWENSKKYGAKVKLYYPSDHKETKDIIYYVTYKVGQEKKRIKVGSKKNKWTEKRAFEQRAKLIDKAKFGTGVHTDMVTVGELSVEYFEWAELHNRSWEKTFQKYNKHLSYFDNKIVMSLKDIDVTKLQKKLKDKKLTDAYNNDVVGILTAIVNFGVKKGIIEYSPFKDLKKIKVDNTRKRFLNKEEINRLFSVVKNEKDFYHFCLLALGTGARVRSVLNMHWKDVDFDNLTIEIKDMKRDCYYVNPISSSLAKQLNDLDFGFLIGGNSRITYHTFRRRFKKVLDELFNQNLDTKDKSRVRMHTLRHTYASWLAIEGEQTHEIQKRMNHADIKMTLRYMHLSPDTGREAVERLYSRSE